MTKTMAARKDRRPRIACELNALNVVAAHAGDGNIIDVSSVRALPAGAITPSLTGTNIANREAVKAALAEAMALLGGRGRDVIMVLPDAACRVVLLDFDTLPDKRDEADVVVRFRLKKSLPFDIERSRVSWQTQRTNDKLMVVAAVTLGTILEEYESALRDVGVIPGVVLPSMLAALGLVDAAIPTLLIKVDAVTTSIAIVDNGALLLARTLDHPIGRPPEGTQLAEDVYPSLVFFQDTYGTKLQRILVSGLASVDDLNATLAEATGIRAQELVDAALVGVSAGPQRSTLGAVAGALV